MCYNVESKTKKALQYAIQRGENDQIEFLLQKLKELGIEKEKPNYHVSGFPHPKLLVFTNHEPKKPQDFYWGLIPAWTKSFDEAKKTWNNTLNARGESIFEKPSFRTSAKNKRCLIYLDAFYEHHHANKQTYPFRIAMKDGSPMVIAGLWEEWTDKITGDVFNTTTIVTAEANSLMTKIHNNPKIDGPRMPVILPKEKQDEWLIDCKTEADKKHLEALIKPLDDNLIHAYTVAKLLGKQAIANIEEVENEVKYPELVFNF